VAKSAFVATVDAVFASHAASPTHRAIFAEVYGAEYAEEVEPLGYLALPELRRVAGELAVGAGDTVADLGCGRGGPGLWVARETGASVVGVDLSHRGVEQARARAASFVPEGRARFQVANLTALPFGRETFAGALSIAVIWSIPSPEAALRETARVLRAGARFVFTDWARTASPPGAPAPIPDHRPLLERAGFEVVAYDVVPGAEGRRRRVYELYLERFAALETEVDPLAAQFFRFEAERALGVLDGVDYLAKSEQVLVVAQR
jgi:ubiquinone/menaquinone biosynthesis C-methylase UbiE